MKFSLIICTYLRAEPLVLLLNSVKEQTKYPDEILVIDGSTNQNTELILSDNQFDHLNYYSVPPQHRGLTKQRNFGLDQVASSSDIVAFLDDDTKLSPTYFEELINTFAADETISGVGGVAVNENRWSITVPDKEYDANRYFQFEGFVYKEGQRNVVRNYLGLNSNVGPGRIPEYSHGKTCGFPLTGRIYEVDLLVGMSFAFRKRVFDSLRFSTYFEGYGLYEDADFSIRALQFGKNVINTKVQLNHYHHPSGRPNSYKYGKMVVRNGWYVWRTKNPKPTFIHQLKWHTITLLLTGIRFSNTLTSSSKKEALTEAIGRTVGWWSLWFKRPY
ncbi:MULTISPECIES: glycosyltransferase family 2 protein [unclassified Flavobacterium]|uniref:glycosyltransferase family 2 protein n=1 Tax=unclassified Flavobacterium TaxID=196869 RepID=UPI00131B826E|nr:MULTISPECIES: glycosyltransferase [unclassified Flavobacterium]